MKLQFDRFEENQDFYLLEDLHDSFLLHLLAADRPLCLAMQAKQLLLHPLHALKFFFFSLVLLDG